MLQELIETNLLRSTSLLVKKYTEGHINLRMEKTKHMKLQFKLTLLLIAVCGSNFIFAQAKEADYSRQPLNPTKK